MPLRAVLFQIPEGLFPGAGERYVVAHRLHRVAHPRQARQTAGRGTKRSPARRRRNPRPHDERASLTFKSPSEQSSDGLCCLSWLLFDALCLMWQSLHPTGAETLTMPAGAPPQGIWGINFN